MPSHLSHPDGSTPSSLKPLGPVKFSGQVWWGCEVLTHLLYIISWSRLHVEYKGAQQSIEGVHLFIVCMDTLSVLCLQEKVWSNLGII